MLEGFLKGLEQPEYIHVLINPLPVYGLAMGLIGLMIGLVAGYFGGVIDSLLMRLMDVMLAFPGILLALAIVSILGPNLANLMIALGISAIPAYARLVRGSVLAAKQQLYVEAARVVGCGHGQILFRHILPNVAPPSSCSAPWAWERLFWPPRR